MSINVVSANSFKLFWGKYCNQRKRETAKGRFPFYTRCTMELYNKIEEEGNEHCIDQINK